MKVTGFHFFGHRSGRQASQNQEPVIRPGHYLSMHRKKPQAALADHLHLLRTIVRSLAPEQYAGSPPGSPFSACIGQHLRHSLDHVRALLIGYEHGTVCYDRRQRGTTVESDRDECVRLLRDFEKRTRDLSDDLLRNELTIEQVIDAGGAMVLTRSTLARELVFVYHHAVHHDALILVMLKLWGVAAPEGFGIAPATLAAGRISAAAPVRHDQPAGDSSLS